MIFTLHRFTHHQEASLLVCADIMCPCAFGFRSQSVYDFPVISLSAHLPLKLTSLEVLSERYMRPITMNVFDLSIEMAIRDYFYLFTGNN